MCLIRKLEKHVMSWKLNGYSIFLVKEGTEYLAVFAYI